MSLSCWSWPVAECSHEASFKQSNPLIAIRGNLKWSCSVGWQSQATSKKQAPFSLLAGLPYECCKGSTDSQCSIA